MSSEPAKIKGLEILQRVGADALDDDDYRQRLIDDPKSVLRGAGLNVADDVEIVIHENSRTRLHLVLPTEPEDFDKLHQAEVDLKHLLNRHPF